MKVKKVLTFLIIILFSLQIISLSLSEKSYKAENQNDTKYTSIQTDQTIGLIFIIVIVLFFIVFLLSLLVYMDANKRGEKGGLWLVIILLCNFFGLIIWFIVRPPIKPKKSDNSFETRNYNYIDPSCQNIGTHYNIDTRGRICTNCGRPIPFDAKICCYCGKKFIDYL